GGPINRMPLGSTPPSRLYFLGCLRKSTTSWISSLASSTPATSLKRTVGRSLILCVVLAFPSRTSSATTKTTTRRLTSEQTTLAHCPYWPPLPAQPSWPPPVPKRL